MKSKFHWCFVHSHMHANLLENSKNNEFKLSNKLRKFSVTLFESVFPSLSILIQFVSKYKRNFHHVNNIANKRITRFTTYKTESRKKNVKFNSFASFSWCKPSSAHIVKIIANKKCQDRKKQLEIV